VNKARVLVPDNNAVYTEKWIKQQLICRYGSHIKFNEVRGPRNVICCEKMSAYKVNQKWHENQSDNSEHIVVTAAKLLKAAIRET
jgi:hypothetical protein